MLEGHGLKVETVDLPSCGLDPGALLDLYSDAGAVRDRLDHIRGPIVVIAHSYGGAPVTLGAAGHRRVQRIVYLSAFMLDTGESCNEVVGGSLPPWCVVNDDGTFMIDRSVAGDVLYGDRDGPTKRWATSPLVPQLAATATQTVEAAAWHDVGSAYLVCTMDRALAPSTQRRLARRASEVMELPTSHSPFLSRPEALAAVVTGQAPR